jgi:hypothetical protein
MSVNPVVLVGLRPMSGDSALALRLSGPAQASLALRPAHLLTHRTWVLSPGFDSSVTLTIAWVATKVYRHLLGPDLHRLH